MLVAAVLLATSGASTASAAPLTSEQAVLARSTPFAMAAVTSVDTELDTVTDSDPGTEPDMGADTETSSGATTSPAADESILENPLGATAEEQQGSTDAEDRKIWAVIGGLLLVAIALTILTVRYWRQTRPAARPAGGTAPSGRRSRTGTEPAEYDDLGSDIFVDE